MVRASFGRSSSSILNTSLTLTRSYPWMIRWSPSLIWTKIHSFVFTTTTAYRKHSKNSPLYRGGPFYQLIEKDQSVIDKTSGQTKWGSGVSKQEYFRRLICQGLTNRFTFRYIVVDCWVSSGDNFSYIAGLGQHFIMPLKSNRKVALSQADRIDFYGLSKGWRIIFVIFFTPTHNGTNAMNQLVTSRINDKHLRLTLFKFASIIILEIPRHLDRRHGTQVD